MSAIIEFLPTVIPGPPQEVIEKAKCLLSDIKVLRKWKANDARIEAFQELKRLKFKHNGLGVLTDNVLLNMPMVSLSSVRMLAEAIGWCIIPIGYLAYSHRPVKNSGTIAEKWDPLGDFVTPNHRQHLKPWSFNSCYDNYQNSCLNIDSSYHLHVLAPLAAYDVMHHINSKDAPIFIPKDISQAFAAVEMSIPIFRSMKRQIEDNREKIDKLKMDVSSLNDRVSRIENDMIAQRLETKKAEKAQNRAYTEWANGLADPVALIFPKEVDVTHDADVYVGPSWGDVPEDVIATLKVLAQMKTVK